MCVCRGEKEFPPFMYGVVHSFPSYHWNQLISLSISKSVTFSVKSNGILWKNYSYITMKRKSWGLHCCFFYCICNHCDSIELNWKSNGLGVFAHFLLRGKLVGGIVKYPKHRGGNTFPHIYKIGAHIYIITSPFRIGAF